MGEGCDAGGAHSRQAVQRQFDLNAIRDEYQRAARPKRRMQRLELGERGFRRVTKEILLDEVLVFSESLAQIAEDYAFLFQLLVQCAVAAMPVDMEQTAGERVHG